MSRIHGTYSNLTQYTNSSYFTYLNIKMKKLVFNYCDEDPRLVLQVKCYEMNLVLCSLYTGSNEF